MQRREFLASLSGLALVVSGIAGCGKGKKSQYNVVKFGGTATYDGQPIPEGFSLLFTPAEGKQSGAATKAGGEFYARYSSAEDGVQSGSLKVTVGWDEEEQGAIPAGFEDLIKSYGTDEGALTISVDKANTSYALDFPKK
ncbi:MAG: hypothetical protein IK077_03965 [Thermoguttaceae bacterium]|nr:hypothetical protein [Thermoguttaceae bacterium]